jgi:hypothetical protein
MPEKQDVPYSQVFIPVRQIIQGDPVLNREVSINRPVTVH